jgi:hypothetical protein
MTSLEMLRREEEKEGCEISWKQSKTVCAFANDLGKEMRQGSADSGHEEEDENLRGW